MVSSNAGVIRVNLQPIFSILFEFRHPHHFIFSTFPKIKTAVFCLFALLALIFFFKKEKTIFRFLLIAVIGIAVYAVAVDVLVRRV